MEAMSGFRFLRVPQTFSGSVGTVLIDVSIALGKEDISGVWHGEQTAVYLDPAISLKCSPPCYIRNSSLVSHPWKLQKSEVPFLV